ncbi:FkbM family methyltransferase [Reyranella sp.]|uniref:FkbM family methyltransferase n=1 Tax=Reyranella sp. TaxID=1929291 RepID=UPI0025FA141C|nr:FkbM family methyltransferase [Reyranella sp.]
MARWLGRWVLAGGHTLRGQAPRFWCVSPPLICRQVIYDRTKRKFFSLKARDSVDLNLMGLIFDKNEYGLERIGRRDELDAQYETIVAQNLSPLIIDCGAHCGIATKFFAETYPQARIVAVEPDEDNVALAREINSEERITVLCAAVGNADGTGRLERQDRSFAHRVNGAVGGATRILSINTLLDDERHRGARPFIVKIVIEGSEENLFADNTDWIDAFPLLIIELHDGMLPGEANARNFLREMGKRNRDFLYHGKNIFSLSNTLG